MDINIHIEKKHFYILLALIVIGFSTMLVFAGHGDGEAYTVSGMFHYLQDIVKGDSLVSVDADNNGAIDTADNCNASSVCMTNTLNATTEVCIANDCRANWPTGLTGSGTADYITKWTGTGSLGNSTIFDNGNVGIGTTSPSERLDVVNSIGDGAIRIGNTANTNKGTIRWTGTDFEGNIDDTASGWKSLTNYGHCVVTMNTLYIHPWCTQIAEPAYCDTNTWTCKCRVGYSIVETGAWEDQWTDKDFFSCIPTADLYDEPFPGTWA